MTSHRTGPHPLWLHLNGGAAMMAAASEGPMMMAASAQILSEAMAGVKAYHAHPARPFIRNMITVAEHNGSRFLSAKEWHGKPYVLLIPSLINGWEIFDIEENFSFALYLYESGFTPLILDWKKPTDTDIPLNDYITQHLSPLIVTLLQQNNPIAGMIGYCMGGTMLAALFSAYPGLKKDIHKVVLIAPPWDFSAQTPEQSIRLQSLAMQTYAMGSPVPNDFVQSLFWAIDPLQVLKKFRKFPDIKNADRFVRVEDWLNAGRPVSKSVVQTCLFDWYRDNAVVGERWTVDGHSVTQDALPQNTLIVAGEKDTLVPLDYIKPLTNSRQFITVDTGHIGLMASDKSVAMWKDVAGFLK